MTNTTIHVLLVEDNPSDRLFVEKLLSNKEIATYQFTAVDYLSDAVEILNTEIFDIVLLDLTLPDSQGIETLEKLLTHSFDIPIIILTGHDDRELGSRSLKAGAQDYLTKSKINAYILCRAIRYAIERHTAIRELQIAKIELANLERKNTVLAMSVTINHEINQPLTVISVYSDLLRKITPPEQLTEKHQKYFTKIDEAINKIQKILTDFKNKKEIYMEDYLTNVQMIKVDEKKDSSSDQ